MNFFEWVFLIIRDIIPQLCYPANIFSARMYKINVISRRPPVDRKNRQLTFACHFMFVPTFRMSCRHFFPPGALLERPPIRFFLQVFFTTSESQHPVPRNAFHLTSVRPRHVTRCRMHFRACLPSVNCKLISLRYCPASVPIPHE